MAPTNSSPCIRPSNIRSLSTYIAEAYVSNARPCCATFLAGGGHDWTCRISGHAFYIDHSESSASTPRTSTSSDSTDASVAGDSIQPFVLPPPAYSARPSEAEDTPFREFPPTYGQVIRASRFNCIRWLPGCARLADPQARALSGTELAGMGLHTGGPPACIEIRHFCTTLFSGDRTWMLPVIILLTLLLGLVLSKCK